MSHAKGPWSVVHEGADTRIVAGGIGAWVAHLRDNGILGDGDGKSPARIANANLIAAAPDLYEFARRMAEHDCTYGDDCPRLDGNPRHGPCVGCLARDAIAKVGR